MTRRKKILLFLMITFIVLTVGINAFIIYQSTLGTVQSTEWSSPVVEVATDIVNTIKPDTITPENKPEFSITVRKAIGHFGLFGIDGILTIFAIYFTTLFKGINKRIRWLNLSLILGIGVAILTEYIQTFVPGRSGEFMDVIIDSSGFLIAYVILIICIAIFENKVKKIMPL